MQQFLSLALAIITLTQAGCATRSHSPNPAQAKAAIEAVLVARVKIKAEGPNGNLLSQERLAELMAVDVSQCPSDFRAAWFDYLVELESLRVKVERVRAVAAAEGKPLPDLPALIKLAVGNPTVGQYLFAALNRVDDAHAKWQRAAMDYGVMPEP